MLNAFFYGIVLSFGLIIPLGVQNTFVLNQGVSQKKFSHALPSALTAFICDLILILSAILGVSTLVLTIPMLKQVLLVVGVVFLIPMGWFIWSNKEHTKGTVQALTIKTQILFSASVSLLNPHALLDTIAVIGTNSLQFAPVEKYAFTFGCSLVSLIWFLFLSFAGYFIKTIDVNGRIISRLNKVSAVIMWLTAAYLASTLWNT